MEAIPLFFEGKVHYATTLELKSIIKECKRGNLAWEKGY